MPPPECGIGGGSIHPYSRSVQCSSSQTSNSRSEVPVFLLKALSDQFHPSSSHQLHHHNSRSGCHTDCRSGGWQQESFYACQIVELVRSAVHDPLQCRVLAVSSRRMNCRNDAMAPGIENHLRESSQVIAPRRNYTFRGYIEPC